jgi:hypothetical protein
VFVAVVLVDELPRLAADLFFLVMMSAFAFIGVAVERVVGDLVPFSLAIGICNKTGFAALVSGLYLTSIKGTGGVALEGLLAVLLLETLTRDGLVLRTAAGTALSRINIDAILCLAKLGEMLFLVAASKSERSV